MAKNQKDSEEEVVDNRIAFFENIITHVWLLKAERWQKLMSLDDTKKQFDYFFAKENDPELFMILSGAGALNLSLSFPKTYKNVQKVFYFKKAFQQEQLESTIDPSVLKKKLFYCELSPNALEAFDVYFNKVVLPVLMNNKNQCTWPRSIKDDLMDHIYKTKRELSAYVARIKGNTSLPIPDETGTDDKSLDTYLKVTSSHELTINPRIRKVLYVFETLVIEWTRQIDLVLQKNSAQPILDGLHVTPFVELEFWSEKKKNVENIYEQLNHPKVQKIAELLEKSDSAYYKAFKNLFTSVVQGLVEAQDINRHLSGLRSVLENYQNADFEESKRLMPPIYHVVCLLWAHCKYYRCPVRITVLLQEINNLVIEQLTQFLTPEELFKGEAEDMIEKVDQALDILYFNRDTYEDYRSKVKQYFPNPKTDPPIEWEFSHELAFARMNAVIRRLETVKELMTTWMDFSKLEKIEFGGFKGSILSKKLQFIAEEFANIYKVFVDSAYNPLDPKEDAFLCDYNQFHEELEILHKKLANLFTIAFQDCSGLESMFKLIAIYSIYSERPYVKEAIRECYTPLLVSLEEELDNSKIIYDNQMEHFKSTGRYVLYCNMPSVSGRMRWAHDLRQRLITLFDQLLLLDAQALECEDGQRINRKFKEILNYLADFEKQIYNNWAGDVDEICSFNLRLPILTRNPKDDLLQTNFDPKLVSVLREVKYLTIQQIEKESTDVENKFGSKAVRGSFKIPQSALNVYSENASLRQYIDTLNITVFRYNHVRQNVVNYEYALIEEDIQTINARLVAGETKISWRDPNAWQYIQEIRDMVKDLYDRLVKSKENIETVKTIIAQLGKSPLFERKETKYESLLDLEDKEDRLEKRYLEVKSTGQRITALLEENRQLFHTDTDNNSWRIYLESIDEIIMEVLVSVMSTSITYLLDQTENIKNTEPLFISKMELEPPEVKFTPGLEIGQIASLYELVDSLVADVLRQGKYIPRVAKHLANNAEEETYQAMLENMNDLNQIRQELLQTRVAPAMQKACEYRDSFDKYSFLWTADMSESLRIFLLYGKQVTMEEMIEGLEECPPTLDQFKQQIDQYEAVYEEVLELEGPIIFDRWFRLDTKPFKKSLLSIIKKWSQMFKQHLLDYVVNSLSDLEQFVKVTDQGLACELREGDYDGLVSVMGHLQAQRERQVATDQMFEPLQEMINLLELYNQEMPPEVYVQLEELPEKWNNTKKSSALIRQALAPLQNHEVSRIRERATQFDAQQSQFREDFRAMPGFQTDCESPYVLLDKWNSSLTKVEKDMHALAVSAKLFDVNIPDYKLIKTVRREIIMLKNLWDMIFMVRLSITDWQTTPWKQVDVDKMDLDCKKFSKDLRSLDSVVRQWAAFTGVELEVKNMMSSLHAVAMLSDPAIRERHWSQLMSATGVHFVMSEETTLAELLSLNLHKFEDEVSTILEQANKEKSMEEVLATLEVTWKTLELLHDKHERTEVTIIKVSEDVMETLEDNQSQLQNLLNSKYIGHFLKEVKSWTDKLSTADMVLNIYMEVQRTWINLESIFIGTEDIRIQLPESSQRFDQIDSDFKDIIKEVEVSTNVIEATNQDGLYNRLESIQSELAICEKALMDYMETKRLAFPRFYFVSHNDLLDILSHGNEPKMVMKHLTKLFDSVAKLKFTNDSAKLLTTKGVWSKDSEYVDLVRSILLEGRVEQWLAALLLVSRDTTRYWLSEVVSCFDEKSRDQWIFDFPAQVALSGSQIGWASETTLAFQRLEEGFENALKDFNKKQITNLNALITMLIGELSGGDRQKIMTICTIDVHNRDVVAKLILQRVENSQAFTWLSQLRHRWDEAKKDCYANICDAEFLYYHEYLGNTPRLVITPLTDRCYITLTQSLHLYMSGAPAGPAGTGKTETTKDLGRALGMMVYVFNCSEQMDYKSIGNIYKGLAQSGAWGCFDEFNRISVEVLSVVAVQVKSIQDALKLFHEKQRFSFLGEEISLANTVGLFITMNPGYAGRTELPENLKALFRPCAMVVPDFDLICEIMLVAEGFLEARLLARKFITLYNLCKELLSKQDHYDWGLRAIKSVLVVAGTLKRSDRQRPEDQVLMRALRDFNIPKIVTDDLPVFMGLIGDLFPALDVPRKRDLEFEKEVREATIDAELQPEESFILKVVQLQELFAVRHSVFIVGNAGTGKSQVWKILNRTYKKAGQRPVAVDLNPKAVTNDELFGIINPATREWKDGLFSVVMRDLSNVTHDGPKWIVLDGDIDPMWIESLNTVMDDNKVLTLASNERITLTSSMRLLFEISHLKTATPATVSRAGILYINPTDLGWQPFVASWINRRTAQTEQANLTVLFDKYIPTLLDAMRSKFKKITPIAEMSHVQMLCYLLECLLQPQHGISPECSKDVYEQFFVFCLVWAFGGCTFQDQLVDHRVEFSRWFLTEFKFVKFPKDINTVFDVFIDPETKKFESWLNKVPKFELDPEIPLQATLVYTNETVRIRYFLDLLLAAKRPVMLVGSAGTGKTVLIQDTLNTLLENSENWTLTNVPFNFYTTSEMLQRVLEKPLEKKAGKNFGPPGSRQLVYFIDDMNMPEVDKYFTVQPHTLIRQHLDYSHWYDRAKLSLKDIHNTQYVACMNPAAGSFTINPRLQRHFCVFAMSMPGPEALSNIYVSILNQHLQFGGEFSQDLKRPQVSQELVETTLQLHQRITTLFLPTAVKFHYSFNLRDLSNIYQGLLFCTPDCVTNKVSLARLWLHECERVYCDKFVDDEDIESYHKIVKEVTKKNLADWFSSGDEVLWTRPLLYCHFARHIGDEKYMPVDSIAGITKILTEALDTYNEINVAMNLVLFEDAIGHILRISRLLETPRGNALLVGVGGSGKQSLSRLAAFLSTLEVFQITLRKGYGIVDLKADLANLYIKTGQKGIGVMFLLTDSQVADEKFLVLVNDLLASGEITDLFPDDEVENICNALRTEVKGQGIIDTKENCWRFFIDRVRRLLKVVLCFSPVGNTLRIRARKFPALVNNTSIDWFHEWPEQALISVSRRFLNDVELLPEELRDSTSFFMAYAHKSVNEMSHIYLQNDRRYNYTTPKSFLEQINLYKNLLEKKHSELVANIERLENGLIKLESTAEQVDALKAKLAVQELEVTRRQQETAQLLEVVEKDTKKVTQEKAIADEEEAKVAVIAAEVQIKAADCAKDLARAEPALLAAQEALNTLNKDNLTEMKAFPQPPALVVTVMEAVVCLMAPQGRIPRDKSWKAAKVLMGKVDQFLLALINYDKDNIHENCLKAVKQYVEMANFDPNIVKSKSSAAAGLCSWVINIVAYNKVYLEVKPKRDALAAAQAELKSANDKLKTIRAKVQELETSLEKLNAEFSQAKAEQTKVMEEAAATNATIELANRLVSGLASEKDRWGQQVHLYRENEKTLPGDVLITVAFLSYVGYFSKQYRTDLMNNMWFKFLKEQKVLIPLSENLDPLKMLVDDAIVATWNNEGLPTDRMSIENAAILTICERWPLMVDPQFQGIKWIKNKYEGSLKVVRIGEKRYLDVIEAAISAGEVILIENIGESIDPVLDPLLGRQTVKKGKAIYVGDREVDFNPKFRLILHTKLANPHYKPEMQAQTTLINFTVTKDGLEDQLLAAVVQKEKPELEQIKSDLTRSQNEFKITLKVLEDELLARLSSATGDFLGDYALVENLENNKATAADIANKVQESKTTESKINEARNRFRPCAQRAALIFFILNELNKISPMYQFSLKAFSMVFGRAMEKAEEAEEEEERVRNLIDSITYSAYVYTSRGLFEKDKLIFASQLAIQILLAAKSATSDEVDFLLRFPVVPNLTSPVEFLNNVGWGGIKALVALESNEFKGLDQDIVGSAKRWKKFVEGESPEKEKFPQEWKNKSSLQQLMMMRALRPDRMCYAMKDFISQNLGSKYVEGRQVEFAKSYEESSRSIPIFFILSPGVDPLKDVEALGKKIGFSLANKNFHNISLGQGQEIVAENALHEAAEKGHWVVLQNVHLVSKWLGTLEKVLESHEEHSSDQLRVFISAEPAATADSHIIPQGILESAVKITNEPPTGMHANLHKAFANFDQDVLEKCSKQVEFQAILFALCYFHAVVSERRKFGAIGWNRSYPFNVGDLTISVDVLYNYLEANNKVPFEDLRYLFGQIMYGGHITDDWDRRLCRAFLEEYLQPELVEGDLDLAPRFRVPPTMDYKGYVAYIDEALPTESPVLYGLHPNAEIEFLTSTANELFRTVFEMQPRDSESGAGGGVSKEEKVKSILDELQDKMPDFFNMPEILAKIPPDERTPFVVVAIQECERMNVLMEEMKRTLKELQLGLKGELTITNEMESLSQSLFLDQVPVSWNKKAYPSLFPLGLWYADLQLRVRELESWVSDFQMPGAVWLAGFFNPQSFLTAIMQQMARKNEWPLDRMCLQVDITKKTLDELQGGAPREGAFVHGLYIEGARWDHNQGISEAILMDLAPAVPVMFIKAIPVDRQDTRSVYACPVYKTKERGPTFVWSFNLKTKSKPSRWVLAGVALLLQV